MQRNENCYRFYRFGQTAAFFLPYKKHMHRILKKSDDFYDNRQGGNAMKKLTLILAVLCLAAIFLGCSAESASKDAVAQSPVVTQTPKSSVATPETFSGKYVGMCDKTSFKAQTDAKKAETIVFVIPEKLQSTFDKLKLKKSDKIKVEYSPNAKGDYEISKITKVKK
jgi:hypothetical protein